MKWKGKIVRVMLLMLGILLAGCALPEEKLENNGVAAVTEDDEESAVEENGYTYENNSDEGIWVDTTQVDQGFLDAVYESEMETKIFDLFDSDGYLTEPCASRFSDLGIGYFTGIEYPGDIDALFYGEPFVLYYLEPSADANGYEVEPVQILPVFVGEYLIGYFYYEEDFGAYENCKFDGTAGSDNQLGIPTGEVLRTVLWMMMGNGKCIFISVYNVTYLVNEQSWYAIYYRGTNTNIFGEEIACGYKEMEEHIEKLRQFSYHEVRQLIEASCNEEMQTVNLFVSLLRAPGASPLGKRLEEYLK